MPSSPTEVNSFVKTKQKKKKKCNLHELPENKYIYMYVCIYVFVVYCYTLCLKYQKQGRNLQYFKHCGQALLSCSA